MRWQSTHESCRWLLRFLDVIQARWREDLVVVRKIPDPRAE
jgi:hypothetical protein